MHWGSPIIGPNVFGCPIVHSTHENLLEAMHLVQRYFAWSEINEPVLFVPSGRTQVFDNSDN